MEKLGIEETKELLVGLKELAMVGKKIAADGKVSAMDLMHLIDLAKNINVLTDAVKGAGEAVKELKDLDEVEVLELIKAIYEMASEVNKA